MPGSRTEELEAFKAQINLSEYAAAQGYAIDAASSSRNTLCMRQGADKIFIAMQGEHWVYWSPFDPSDSGTIIDFVQKRKRLDLGRTRIELRPWIGPGSRMSRPAPSLYVQKLQPVPKDIIAVRARYSAAESVSDKGGIHPYLNEQRALPASLIASDRFAGRVAIDYRGCALWPHWNEDGLCGYEIRGPEFKGFAAGAYKGLWGSRISEQDHELVIAESALNAMSYAALHGFACTRFVSTAGTMNEHQPGLVRLAIEKLPIGGTVIAAVDHDVAGQTIAEQLRAVFEQIGRKDLRFRIDCPPNAGGDWNDVLKSASHIAGLNNPEPA